MTPATVELRIRGADLRPETLKAGDLAKVLVCLEKVIAASTAGSDSETVLSLTGVTDGSARLSFWVPPVAWPAVAALLTALNTADYHRIPRDAQSGLAELSRLFAGHQWEGEFTGQRLPRATLSAANPVPEPRPGRQEGDSVLFGRCLQVGGVNPFVKVRRADGRDLNVRADEELVCQLGEHLYEEVQLEGTAVWDTADWRLVEFRATKLLPTPADDPLAAFAQLAELSGGVYDGVDADDYVRRLRDEEGGE